MLIPTMKMKKWNLILEFSVLFVVVVIMMYYVEVNCDVTAYRGVPGEVPF